MRHTILSIALCLFFTIGVVGVPYHDCNMTMPAEEEQAMAGMSCHGQMTSIPKPQKKCCIDLSCPKCFGTHLTTARFNVIEFTFVGNALPTIATNYFSSRNPAAPERPPKFV